MGCGCRRGSRAGSVTPTGLTVTGFEYTAPDKTTVSEFLTLIEAKKEQRRNGGGTIKQLTG